MNVNIDGQQIALDILNCVSQQYDNTFMALDALCNGKKCFKFELKKSRLLQEEPQKDMNLHNNRNAGNAAALISFSVVQNAFGTLPFNGQFCCKKDLTENRGWNNHLVRNAKLL